MALMAATRNILVLDTMTHDAPSQPQLTEVALDEEISVLSDGDYEAKKRSKKLVGPNSNNMTNKRKQPKRKMPARAKKYVLAPNIAQ